MKAISYSTCDHDTHRNAGAQYHYKTYTVRAAQKVAEEILMRFIKSRRVESFSGVTDYWYFDVDEYKKSLDAFGIEIPSNATRGE